MFYFFFCLCDIRFYKAYIVLYFLDMHHACTETLHGKLGRVLNETKQPTRAPVRQSSSTFESVGDLFSSSSLYGIGSSMVGITSNITSDLTNGVLPGFDTSRNSDNSKDLEVGSPNRLPALPNMKTVMHIFFRLSPLHTLLYTSYLFVCRPTVVACASRWKCI